MAEFITKGANVSFKHGPQSTIDLYFSGTKTATEGTFYLTNDTHRLYVGQKDGKVAPVNEGIIVVNDVSGLPPAQEEYAGQFYYLTKEGILAVCNGKAWVQINENTNTTYEYTGKTTDGENTVTVKTQLSSSIGADMPFEFTLTGANGIEINSVDNTITIDGNKLKHNLSTKTKSGVTNEQALSLSNGTGDPASEISLKSGTNVTILREDDGSLNFTAKDTTLDKVTITNKESGFTVAVDDTSGVSQSASLDPIITLHNGENAVHFVNGTATLNAYSVNEIDSKMRAVDAMVYRGLWEQSNLPTTNDDISNGDTWKLNTSVNEFPGSKQGDIVIARGTEDPSTGLIISDLDFDWIPSGNDDTTYKGATHGTHGFSFINNASGELTLSYDLTSAPLDNSFEYIKLENIDPEGTDNQRTVRVLHKLMGENTTAAVTEPEDMGNQQNSDTHENFDQSSITIPAITKVKLDSAGHVISKGVEKIDYTLRDTNAILLQDMLVTVAKTAGTAEGVSVDSTLVTTLEQANGAQKTATGVIRYKSLNDSIRVTPGDKGVNFNLVWDTFE